MATNARFRWGSESSFGDWSAVRYIVVAISKKKAYRLLGPEHIDTKGPFALWDTVANAINTHTPVPYILSLVSSMEVQRTEYILFSRDQGLVSSSVEDEVEVTAEHVRRIDFLQTGDDVTVWTIQLSRFRVTGSGGSNNVSQTFDEAKDQNSLGCKTLIPDV